MPRNSNPYMMNGTNPYRQQDNKYDSDNYGEDTGSETMTQKTPSATDNQMQDQEQEDMQSTAGFMHGLAGLAPQFVTDAYMFGYDEGIISRSASLAHQEVEVVWSPFVAGCIRGVASTGHEVIVQPSENGVGGRMVIYSRQGEAISRHAFSDLGSVEMKVKSSLRSLASGGFSFDRAMTDVLYDNPEADFFEAVDLARSAHLLASKSKG